MENNKQSKVIFADLLSNEVKYLCRRSDGSLYTCIVSEGNGNFCEKYIKNVTVTEARIFVATTFNRSKSVLSEFRFEEHANRSLGGIKCHIVNIQNGDILYILRNAIVLLKNI